MRWERRARGREREVGVEWCWADELQRAGEGRGSAAGIHTTPPALRSASRGGRPLALALAPTLRNSPSCCRPPCRRWCSACAVAARGTTSSTRTRQHARTARIAPHSSAQHGWPPTGQAPAASIPPGPPACWHACCIVVHAMHGTRLAPQPCLKRVHEGGHAGGEVAGGQRGQRGGGHVAEARAHSRVVGHQGAAGDGGDRNKPWERYGRCLGRAFRGRG
jgi:hypothetical protein